MLVVLAVRASCRLLGIYIWYVKPKLMFFFESGSLFYFHVTESEFLVNYFNIRTVANRPNAGLASPRYAH